jgi:transposase-like protein
MSKAMSSDPITPSPRVEVIKSVQRRRRWSTAEKVRLVEEAMQPGSSVSFVARRYGLSPSLLFTWKRRMLEGGHQAVQADEDVVGTSRVRELERRVRDLERLLGRKTMEAEISGKRSTSRGQKTSVAAAVLERGGGRFAMKAVAETLGVARSNLAERRAKPARPRGPYRKPEDEALLPAIRRIVDERPTYGYGRITALVNRVLRAEGVPVVNAKRVLRIMRLNWTCFGQVESSFHEGGGLRCQHPINASPPSSGRRLCAWPRPAGVPTRGGRRSRDRAVNAPERDRPPPRAADGAAA